MVKVKTAAKPKISKFRCGLCGSTRKELRKTDCCGNWICNDEGNYVLFSYARNSCSRNHRRFTLCGFHHENEHKGDWTTCKKCLQSFPPEMCVWYGANEYNFKKMSNPPSFEPTYCSKCGKRIILPDGGYSSLYGVYRCEDCEITGAEREKKIIAEYKAREQISKK